MARSSIQGASLAPTEPAGRDTAALGPGDSSDSGSDMMGIDDSEGGDPNIPADVAAREDESAAPLTPEALDSSSDASGTGESRSATGDGGRQDGWDIGVDRVFAPGGGDADADAEEDLDLSFMDGAQAITDAPPGEEEEADEAPGGEEPEGDAVPPKPAPGHPNGKR
ncbi:hypothetical protein [Hydrogenophaga sp. BPS33]|uniref:hypothetical protein n=1 Tax=Hydrogenophaga sp. BPS33 TaxID=2651974 RepID=UPI00131FC0C0|nr:hypothetical protein [Hydrogenophaga sp. BPS33]QHE88167.1 hypothetical protein F9K07_26355 [Hydrogenophaga sp. BPS33]